MISYLESLLSFCCGGLTRRNSQYHILDEENEAAQSLLQFLGNRANVDFFVGEPLGALKTLAYSENLDLQRSAGLALAEVTDPNPGVASREGLQLIISLLKSPDTEVQRSASAALGNLASNNINKLPIVEADGLQPLINLMSSHSFEVQCNAVGCITNLSSHEANKGVIARSGALDLLISLAQSSDRHVRQNATGALLNLTHPHPEEIRSELVRAGAVSVLESLLSASDPIIQYHCTTALANIAVDESSRQNLPTTNPFLVDNLLNVLKHSNDNVICQATLALRNLASDPYYQTKIVQKGGLDIFYDILDRVRAPVVACIRNISIHVENEQAIMERGFLNRLVPLISIDTNTYGDDPQTVEDIQCHAISTLRNLAASSDSSKSAIFEAGVVSICAQRILKVADPVQREITALIAVLALNRQLELSAIPDDVFKVLIQLTHSDILEVQGNSAAALGNLSSKLRSYKKASNFAVQSYNRNPFVNYWNDPHGGVSGYLEDFVKSPFAELKHIAVWTLHELEESWDPDMIEKIEQTPAITKQLSFLASINPDTVADEGDISCWIDIKDLSSRCCDLLSNIKRPIASREPNVGTPNDLNTSSFPV